MRAPFVALLILISTVVGTIAAQVPPTAPQSAPGDYVVSVSPHGGTIVQALNTRDTVQFTVSNDGTLADAYTFTCSVTGAMGCVSVSPASATIQPELFKKVTVIYDVGPSSGDVQLTATGHATDIGWFTVTSDPTITLVAPVLTSGSRAVVHNRQPILLATFLPNGSDVDSTKTVLTWKRGSTTDTVSTLARANRGLIEWEVDSTHWIAVGDSALMTVKVCALNGLCGSATRWAVLLNDSKPVLGFTGMPLEALGRQFSAPFGPGLAVNGGEVETGFSIPAYVSMGAPRSAGLTYSTRQSYPRALVPVDVELTWPTGTPDQLKVILWDGAVRLDSLVLTSPTCATGSARRCRAVLQGDFGGSSFSSPTRKWLTVEIRVTSGGTTNSATDSVEVFLVDRRSTRYGAGWWPSGVLQLAAAGNDRVLVGASGSSAIYRGNGDSLYLAPPGDFSVLKRTASGWELSPRGSLAKLVFDTNGRLIKSVDANGNRDSLAYSGSSDQVTSLTDPVNKTIRFVYSGTAKLDSIVDPTGRRTRIVIDGTTNQLTYDSISSATARPYTTRYVYKTYPGTNTAALTKRIGVIADTTVVTYDSTFRRRPSQVTLPEVQDENGSAVKPVIGYFAYERQGFGALRPLDSVYVELKDPRNNWMRSLLNRWAQARKTWDQLALLGRMEYTAEGLALWAEGKNGDSSRVYSRYDALRRLVRTYIVRSATDTLKLDSLLYDVNHRVIARIDARGKRDSVVYDALGNVLRTITPHNDTTKFWYRSDGLLDSTRAPGSSATRRFGYDATWKNLRVIADSAFTVDSTIMDALGRDSIHLSKVRVQVTTTTSKWQWQRVEAFFNAAGQADSTRLARTDDCNDPCTQPPSWPAANDTLRTQRVGHRFDRAGRDSLRINDRGKATLYLYDRLGRLVSRRPWTDSMAVKDSIVYDIDGNVKKSITRRGDVITSSYDVRNRDTLTVIPGVGDMRRTFGGPLDQVTRLWFDNFVDSIGGVNAALAWVYDQRGRLKSDTSFTGTVGRGTTYTYDGFERPSTTVDVVGTWTVRYEADRGYADTLITPFADTIRYTFDARDRAMGPYLRSSGPLHSRLQAWNATGGLRILTNSVGTAPSYVAGKWDRKVFPDDPLAALGPVWTEQHGAGTGADSLQDSLNFDGWERLAAWVGFKNGVAAARDSFQFDRLGNITRAAGLGVETFVYDGVTSRLLSSYGGSYVYAYDRAGNLVQQTAGAHAWVYGYDALNRLRSARYDGALIARYAYDVLGRRIAKRVYSNGTVAYTRFVYRGANVGFETDSAGTIGLRYTWGPAADDLLAIRDAAGNHFYVVQDKLRSVRGLVKRDGTWIMSQRFSPYGGRIAFDTNATGPGFELRYGWTGREFDPELNWYYFRARYYDAGARRFVQEDPIGYGGGGNLYAYTGGNPIERRDPSGLMANYDLMYIAQCRCGNDNPSTWDEWQFISDGNGGGEWMPPGMNAQAREAFAAGVAGMGNVIASNTLYVVTVAMAGGGTATITTGSPEVAASAVVGNLGPRNMTGRLGGPPVFSAGTNQAPGHVLFVFGSDPSFDNLPQRVHLARFVSGPLGSGVVEGTFDRVSRGRFTGEYEFTGHFDGFSATGAFIMAKWGWFGGVIAYPSYWGGGSPYKQPWET